MSQPPYPSLPSQPVSWPDSQREAAFHAWLSTVVPLYGLQPQSLRPASADASFRRYLRMESADARSFIIMDAPPDKEDCKPFVNVAALMHQAGLRVPDILAWDEPSGFMLLSDMGAHTMMAHIHAATPPEYLAHHEDRFWPRPEPTRPY